MLCFILSCCYVFFVVHLLWGRIPPARWSANILNTIRIQRVSDTHSTEELVIKTAKTKRESTGSFWNPKLFPSLLYLINAASVWPHRFSNPPLLKILYFKRAEIITSLLAENRLSCHFLTRAVWNEPQNLFQSIVALMDPFSPHPTMYNLQCWHVTAGTTAFLSDIFMLFDNWSDTIKHGKGCVVSKQPDFWVRDSGSETSPLCFEVV